MLNSYCLEKPALNFGEDGVPRSSTFDDVYFDKEAGLEETRYVFLQHNQLDIRFSQLAPKQAFTIAETGFGTGLNFLCAVELFLKQAPQESHLHFISVEKYPLTKASLADSLRMWPSLSSLSNLLLAHYPTLCYGLNVVHIPEIRTTLTLWFGEAHDGFKAINAKIDAWFLDGFAPSKNPEMWSDQLFKNIQRLSYEGSTFATFTAAGIVRRGLLSHGFEVQKVKGFGHKREMMVGQFQDPISPHDKVNPPAWFHARSTQPITKVLVVGSGLAGATTANALAKRGVKVDVWEKESTVATGGSGNEQGMLYPKLSSSDRPLNRFYLSSYLYAHRFYNALPKELNLWGGCGLIQTANSDEEQKRFDRMFADGLYPEDIVTPHGNGLWLPLSGWVRPQALCEHLLSHAYIRLFLNRELQRIEQTPDGFIAFDSHTETHYSHIVICTANELGTLQSWNEWPTKPIRGQVTRLPIQVLGEALKEQVSNLKTVLCQDGYVSPVLNEHLNFGATYDLGDNNLHVTKESHEENLRKLSELLSVPVQNLPIADCEGRVGMRCTITDYAPIIGPMSDQAHLISHYGKLRYNAKWHAEQACELIKGLYVNVGHGSRGLVSTPISAAYLCSLILQEAAPIEQKLIEVLHPNRFTIRQLKRGEA